jgi:Flp pilus assembly protein TadG
VNSLSREDGNTVVEMALASLILFAMLFGIIEFAYAFYAYNFVSEGAREAARYAIVRGNTSCTNTPGLSGCGAANSDIQTFLRTSGYAGLSATNLTTSTTWLTPSSTQPTTWSACGTTSACKSPGNAVQVTVVYAFPLSIPFWQAQTINMASTAQMVISQ